MVRTPCAFAARAAAFAGVEAEARRRVAARLAPPACRRTACGSCPRSRCRWPGRSAASCRSASGRPRARGRSCSPAVDRARSRCHVAGASRRGRLVALHTMACTLASSTSRASVDLPEPLTPVTATRRCSGTSTVDVAAGCAGRAPRSSSQSRAPGSAAAPARRGCSGCFSGVRAGSGRSPNRRAPPRSADACPRATSRPPRLPAPGPMSMMWSARRIVSSSCSTTTSVLPLSPSLCSASSRIWLSRGCRPMVGSSST